MPTHAHQSRKSLARLYAIEAALQTLLEEGFTRTDLAAYAGRHNIPGMSDASLSRWAAGHKTRADVDQLVDAVASLTLVQPITIWQRALEEWSHDLNGSRLAGRIIQRQAAERAAANAARRDKLADLPDEN